MTEHWSGLRLDLANLVNAYGTQVKVQNRSIGYSGAEYDIPFFDNSGTVITISGLMMALGPGEDDRRFLEQGLIDVTDKKVYFASGIDISQNAVVVAGGGSWTVPDNGIRNQPDDLRLVYKRVFLRNLRP